MIAKELDECAEVLFIEKGWYNIGYEINKKVHFRKKLGPVSIIGGFQILNNWRFEFIYQTCTIVKAQAIRKENFLRLVCAWPQFKSALNSKFYREYGDKVYLPLIKKKNMEIMDLNFRADYDNILYLQQTQSKKFISSYIRENLQKIEDVKIKWTMQQININKQIMRISSKVDQLICTAFEIAQKTEKLLQFLFGHYKTAIANGELKVDDSRQLILQHYNYIFDFKI